MSASGEILNEEFLKPLGLTANALAKAIEVSPNRITAILKDERGITGTQRFDWERFSKRRRNSG
jgi:addiction module HigA family antidote